MGAGYADGGLRDQTANEDERQRWTEDGSHRGFCFVWSHRRTASGMHR